MFSWEVRIERSNEQFRKMSTDSLKNDDRQLDLRWFEVSMPLSLRLMRLGDGVEEVE